VRERSEEDLDSSHFIGHYEKAPQFMVDNTNITDGYRINFNTPSRIIKSLFMIHNESVNIWSHCLPALFFIFILISFMFVIDGESFRASFT
jgi:adiponectin receptor